MMGCAVGSWHACGGWVALYTGSDGIQPHARCPVLMTCSCEPNTPLCTELQLDAASVGSMAAVQGLQRNTWTRAARLQQRVDGVGGPHSVVAGRTLQAQL